ncbi:MAG: AI-2E family transporter [Chloroflexi bacterium]|nr:AI-2E family transporter [Chloroflexota bacterium]
MPGPTRASITRLLLPLAASVIVLAGVKQAAGILNPLLLALFILLVLVPMLRWLRERGLPGWLAVTTVASFVLLVGAVGVTYTVVTAKEISDKLPEYKDQLAERQETVENWLEEQGVDVAALKEDNNLDGNDALQFAVDFALGMASTLTSTVLMGVVLVYLLAESAGYSKRFHRAIGEQAPFHRALEDFARDLGKFMNLRAWLGLIAAIFDAILLWALGVDFAVFWGVLSFAMSFIPNVGFIIALVPPTVLAFIEFGVVKSLVVLGGYIAINSGIDYIVAPRMLGRGLNLSPLVTFLAVVFWAWILGAPGAFLALPLTLAIKKLVLEQFEETRWIAAVIGTDDGARPAALEPAGEAPADAAG